MVINTLFLKRVFMKKFLFLLVAIPLSAESMERTVPGCHFPQRRNAQRPPLPRLEEETLAALQLPEGGRSQSLALVDQQPRQGDSTQKVTFKKDDDPSCCEECARVAGLVAVSFGLSIIFTWLKDYSKKTD
jgi:hypothetical protein